jgi:adenine phosphoribosyltransferase
MDELKAIIRDIPDFPKPGIVFKDITPVLGNGPVFRRVIDTLRNRYAGKKIDVVAGIEARGFVFAAGLAYALGSGLVIIRKPGKLPYKTFRETYDLEYGKDAVEIHQDAVKPGQTTLIVDDVLATGGTVNAVAKLLKSNFQTEIVEAVFIVELDFLRGREKLPGLPIHSLVHY